MNKERRYKPCGTDSCCYTNDREYVEDLEKIAELSEAFLLDVLPQIHGLAIQRYDNLNKVLNLLTKHNKDKKQ